MKNPDDYVEKVENRIYGAKNSTYAAILAIAAFVAIVTIWVSGF